MCCGTTGYILKVSPYTGAWNELDQDEDAQEIEQLKESGKVVRHLSNALSNTGSIIFIDNYYTAVNVCDYLSRKGLGCVGALRMNRTGLPEKLRYTSKKTFPARPGEDPVFWRRRETTESPYPLVCCAWYDKKPIGFLSTVYSSALIQKAVKSKDVSRRAVKVPEIAVEYSNYMGGVDLSDQRKKSYSFPHPAKKWYIHMYHYFVESCLNNSLITFNDLRIYEREKVSALQFRWELIDGLLNLADILEHSDVRDMTRMPDSSYKEFVPANRRKNASERLTGRHFAEKVGGEKFCGGQCVVCRSTFKRRRQVKYKCPDCDVYLCPQECFKIFHTAEDYEHYAT